MPILQGIQVGIHRGIVRGINPGVPVDGPGGVFVPERTDHFQALGAAVPDHLLLCQEASGNLLPAIGTVQLAPNNSPLFRQSVVNWSRWFVGTTNNVADQRFGTTSATLDLAAGESYAVVAYMALGANGVATRIPLTVNRFENEFLQASNNTLLVQNNAVQVQVAGGAAYGDITVVRPFVWFRNATLDQSGAKTDLGETAVTHAELAVTGRMKAIGPDTGGTPATVRCCWLAFFKGANAERDWKDYLKRLNWKLSY